MIFPLKKSSLTGIMFLSASFAIAQGKMSAPGWDIPNFQVVNTGIARGGRPPATAFRALAAAGYKTILNLQGGDSLPGFDALIRLYEPGEKRTAIEAEAALAKQLGLRFFNVPFNSLRKVSARDAELISSALEILTNPNNQPVFVHCEHGKDRTGLVIALERVLKEDWSPAKAHDEYVAMGHTGWLNHLFTGYMDDYFYAVTKK